LLLTISGEKYAILALSGSGALTDLDHEGCLVRELAEILVEYELELRILVLGVGIDYELASALIRAIANLQTSTEKDSNSRNCTNNLLDIRKTPKSPHSSVESSNTRQNNLNNPLECIIHLTIKSHYENPPMLS
jgi:hypothetical protein